MNDNREIKKQLLELWSETERIQSKIKELVDILTQNGVGMFEPLVDAEGFPLNSVDVYQVRNARHKIICLQNDHENLMKTVEDGLREYYAPYFSDDNSTSDTPIDTAERPEIVVHKTPFAKVTLVTPGSPADHAGINANDEVVEFGSIKATNFKNISDIASVVQHSESAEIRVELKRGESYIGLSLVPRKWAGKGMLGCTIVGI